MTDSDGEVYEHLECFPFGETRVHQHTNTNQRLAYNFTGKELDESTGFYYFGARYFDPRANIWISPDPILADYAAGLINGGVYSPANLGLYSYSYQNPVTLKDGNGEFVLQVLGAAVTAYDAYQNYQEGGWTAVGKGLATDLAVNMATGGVGKLAMKAGKAAATTARSSGSLNDAAGQARQASAMAKREAGVDGAVALDNNALIAAIENGESAAVDAALKGRTPVVSRQAVKEFLKKGDKSELREFLSDRGGKVGKAGSEADVRALQDQAAQMKPSRNLRTKDARVAASAQAEGVPLITRDKKLRNFMNESGLGGEGF